MIRENKYNHFISYNQIIKHLNRKIKHKQVLTLYKELTQKLIYYLLA